jgi:hypothetical protein
MAKANQPRPNTVAPVTFGSVTKETARRNEEAQKAARARRAAREREQLALRRQWERL